MLTPDPATDLDKTALAAYVKTFESKFLDPLYSSIRADARVKAECARRGQPPPPPPPSCLALPATTRPSARARTYPPLRPIACAHSQLKLRRLATGRAGTAVWGVAQLVVS